MPNTGMASPVHTPTAETVKLWTGRLALTALWAVLAAKLITAGPVWVFGPQAAVELAALPVVISRRRRIVTNVRPEGTATIKSIPRRRPNQPQPDKRRLATVAGANDRTVRKQVRAQLTEIGRICHDYLPMVDSANGNSLASVSITPDGEDGWNITVKGLNPYVNQEGHEVKHGPDVHLPTTPKNERAWEQPIALACRLAQLQVLEQTRGKDDPRVMRAHAAVRAAQLAMLAASYPMAAHR